MFSEKLSFNKHSPRFQALDCSPKGSDNSSKSSRGVKGLGGGAESQAEAPPSPVLLTFTCAPHSSRNENTQVTNGGQVRNSKVQLVRWGEGGAWGHDRVWWYGVCLTNQFSGFNPSTAKEKKNY